MRIFIFVCSKNVRIVAWSKHFVFFSETKGELKQIEPIPCTSERNVDANIGKIHENDGSESHGNLIEKLLVFCLKFLLVQLFTIWQNFYLAKRTKRGPGEFDHVYAAELSSESSNRSPTPNNEDEIALGDHTTVSVTNCDDTDDNEIEANLNHGEAPITVGDLASYGISLYGQCSKCGHIVPIKELANMIDHFNICNQ